MGNEKAPTQIDWRRSAKKITDYLREMAPSRERAINEQRERLVSLGIPIRREDWLDQLVYAAKFAQVDVKGLSADEIEEEITAFIDRETFRAALGARSGGRQLDNGHGVAQATINDTKKDSGKKYKKVVRHPTAAAIACGEAVYAATRKMHPETKKDAIESFVLSHDGEYDGQRITVDSLTKVLQANPQLIKAKTTKKGQSQKI